nr:MAG TPA: hypothetical protein [Caudoviricetes sp.]
MLRTANRVIILLYVYDCNIPPPYLYIIIGINTLSTRPT